VFRVGAEDADAPKLHDMGERFKVRVGLVTATKQGHRVSVRTHEELRANDACGGGSIIDALLISPAPNDRRKFGGVGFVQNVNVISPTFDHLVGKRRAVFDHHWELAMNHHS
jgi:hypothetical protein